LNFGEWDRKIFLLINGLAESRWDYLFGWSTFLGTYFLFLLVLIFMLIWDQHKVFKKFLVVLIVGTSGGLAASLFKSLIKHPRPYTFFYDDIAAGKVVMHNLFNTYVSNSFPSGHAALAFATVVALNTVYKGKLPFLYLFAVLIAVSRIYVGAHFPSDVLGGALVGTFAALAVTKLQPIQKIIEA